MFQRNAVVAVYDTHVGAERAVKALQRAGTDMCLVHHCQGLPYRGTRRGLLQHGRPDEVLGQGWSCLGKRLGITGRGGILCHSRRRAGAGSGSCDLVDRGSAGRAVIGGGMTAIGAGLYGYARLEGQRHRV